MLLITLALYVFLVLYFLARYARQRRVQSLTCAVMALGWPLAVLRELHACPRWIAEGMLAGAAAVGLLCTGLILIHEAQKEHPFR